MAKISAVESIASVVLSAVEQRLYITSQGKGGCFKSGISSLVAQYCADKGYVPKCYDADPTNATLTKFEALRVTHISVVEHNTVDIGKFDELTTGIVSQPGPFIVDTGATTFYPFWDYVAQNDLIGFFGAQDRQVIVNCPVVGGQALGETVKGLDAICRLMPPRSVVVWANAYFGAVRTQDKALEEFAVIQDNAEKILGIVHIGDASKSLHRQDLSNMLDQNRTFQEMLADPTQMLIKRHRLAEIKKNIYSQLQAVGL